MTSKKEDDSFTSSVKKTLGLQTETVNDKVSDLVETMKDKINEETCKKLDDVKDTITKGITEDSASVENTTEMVDDKLTGTQEKEHEGFFQSVKDKFTDTPDKAADENASFGETNLEASSDTLKDTLKRPLEVVGVVDNPDFKRTNSA